MSARRVAVTRDEGRDGPLATALAACGHDVVPCPAVCEEPSPEAERLADAAGALERYDWLVVASARAVAALLRARADAPLPGALRTAAAGERTAALLVEHGAHDVLTAPGAGAHALLAALLEADRWDGRRVLAPRAVDGSREIAERLRAAGASVDEIAAYRTRPRPPAGIAAAWEAGHPDAAVFASPSAVRATAAAIGAAALAAVECVAIGDTTAAALRELGVAPVVAPRADFDSVARAVGNGAPIPASNAPAPSRHTAFVPPSSRESTP